MIEHYSINFESPSFDFMERILDEAHKNPRSFVIDRGTRLKTICFEWSAYAAQRSATSYKQGCSLSDTVAFFRLSPEGISRDPESGSDETFAQLAEFIRWILKKFPNWHVTNEETGEDVTELVKADPDILFVPDWKRTSP